APPWPEAWQWRRETRRKAGELGDCASVPASARELLGRDGSSESVWLLNRPIPGLKWLGWRGFDILFQLRFRKEMKALPWSQICARSLRRAEPPFARLSFSHYPRCRASWKPIGQNRLKE